MIYLPASRMKKLLHILRPAALIGIGLLLAIASAALSQPVLRNSSLSASAFAAQATATAPAADTSRIGSTDGIVWLSVVIVLIVVIPILLRRDTWSR